MISNEDQDRLRTRALELVAVFIKESDPVTWPTADTKEGRGDRVWLKKSATQTLVLVEQIRQLLARLPSELPEVPGAALTDEEQNDQKLIADAEALAAQIIGRSNGPTTPH